MFKVYDGVVRRSFFFFYFVDDGRLDSFHLFGAPYLPIAATPFPLPVRYHIHYGEPIHLSDTWRPEQSDDPDVTGEAAQRVKSTVQEMIDRGLEMREGVFR